MITLAFDQHIRSKQKHGGISRYLHNLEHGVSTANDIEHVGHDHAQIVHATFYSGRPQLLPGTKLVCSLYDMTPELYPGLFPLGRIRQRFGAGSHARKKHWLAASDLIISISHASAVDLQHVWPEIKVPIRVVHLGTEIHQVSSQALPELAGRRFWLMVGKRYGYKNGAMLLRALRCLADDPDPPLLIAAGGGSWSRREIRLIREHQLQQRVRQFQVTDHQLSWLYKHSEAVFIPSLAEGFSLPLIEALCCNTACIASDLPAHREVGGRFAQLLPSTTESLWMEMLTAINTIPLSAPRSQLGDAEWLDLCQHYSLANMIDQHCDLYRMLAAGSI